MKEVGGILQSTSHLASHLGPSGDHNIRWDTCPEIPSPGRPSTDTIATSWNACPTQERFLLFFVELPVVTVSAEI